MEAAEIVQKLNEISLKKLELVREILLYTRSEKDALAAERLDDMQTLLNEKQQRMDAVDKLDEHFALLTAKLKSSLSLSSLEELPKHHLPGVKELKEVVSQIHQLLGEIKELEDENIAWVKAEMQDTREKIKQAENFKRVRGAYKPVNGNTPSYFFDTKK